MNYASFPLRRLPAEVLLDALNTATGTTEKMDMKYHHWPAEMTTVEVPFLPKNPFVAFVLETYGRPKRNAAVQCDCERDGELRIRLPGAEPGEPPASLGEDPRPERPRREAG